MKIGHVALVVWFLSILTYFAAHKHHDDSRVAVALERIERHIAKKGK